MSSVDTTSSAAAASKVPKTSPMASHKPPSLRRMTSDGSGAAAVVPAIKVDVGNNTKNIWSYAKNGWVQYPGCDHDIRIVITQSKHRAVAVVLHKYQNGLPTKRVTSDYLIEGIQDWIEKVCVDVVTVARQDAFVRHVWHYMRKKQRDNAAEIEAQKLRMGLQNAKMHLESHYKEFPDERKSDDELVSMFRRLSVWSSVISSEQRRIASKKRHDKEERLIHEKFCGDRAAYNRWKALNEQVSYGRIRDVSPQLLVKFAKWFEENPDFLYPGSRCVAVETAGFSLKKGLSELDYSQVRMTRADVSKEHMLAAISSIMNGLKQGTCTVTLKFDRSPKQFAMTDKYPLLAMHGCQRLISHSEHRIVAVHSDKLVFEATTVMIKRLPEEFHRQLKGHCEREGLFKEVTCHKVYEYTPGLVTSVLFRGQTNNGDKFHIRLRQTDRADKTFDFASIQNAKHKGFLDSLKEEAVAKKESARQARLSSIKSPKPPSPGASSYGNLVKELAELSKLFRDGLLSETEFKMAKARLI